MRIRTYSELMQHDTFLGRYNYLKLHGSVGRSTFGFDRHINQTFYTSREWRQLRNEIVVRDLGCDLGVEGFDIEAKLLIHHMNPITADDITSRNPDILDPEFLITTTDSTHNAIHFGDESLLPRPSIERRSGDTKLW